MRYNTIINDEIIRQFEENGRRYKMYMMLSWNYRLNRYTFYKYILYKVIIRCGKDVLVYENEGYTIDKCLNNFKVSQAQAQARKATTKARQAEKAKILRIKAQAQKRKLDDYYSNSANYYISDIMDTYKNTINDYIF